MPNLWETFDVIAWLDDINVPYATIGKNVSAGWVNIQCPYCDDHSNHLGINLSSKQVHCWRCPHRSGIKKLIADLEEINYSEVDERLGMFQSGFYFEEPFEAAESIELPAEATDEFPPGHLQYLKGRKFDPEELISSYQLKACAHLGPYKFRIIIPVFINGRLVNFVGRDITNRAELRYKAAANRNAVLPLKDLVYNLDSVRKNVLITEGPFDVWRIGPGAVGLLGTEYTKHQVNLLVQLQAERFFVLFDGEPIAFEKARQLAKTLSMSGKDVEVIQCPEGRDPADLTTDEVAVLRKELSL